MRTKQLCIILSVVLVFLIGCSALQFKWKVENKLAIALESGFQIMYRTLAAMPEGETKIRFKANAEAEFTKIRDDLDNEELAIDASYIKEKLYEWVDKGLTDFGSKMSEADKRLVLKTKDFFYLEGGYEATPEHRVIGIAFCDGVLEAL